MSIEISLRSQKLINQYLVACALNEQALPDTTASLDYGTLLSWLGDQSTSLEHVPEKSRREIEFFLMLVRAELLHDLRIAMEGEEAKESVAKQSFANTMKFVFLSLAGLLVTVCEGFDSIVTMMSMFSVSSAVIFACAFTFSLCAAIAFCGFDLFRISNSMGVKLSEAHKLLDVYLRQFEEIKLIRKKIGAYNFSQLPHNELDNLVQLIELSQQRLAQIIAASDLCNKVLNSKRVQITKLVLSCIAGALFFGGAFCAGQTTALFVLGLFITTITPLSLPVVLFSLLVGCAALSLYLCLEFPGLKNLISGWFGLDEEKIAKLCNHEMLVKEEKKLADLKAELVGVSDLKEQLSELKQVPEVNAEQVKQSLEIAPKPSVGTNIYSFMRAPRPPVVDQLETEAKVKSSCRLGCTA